MNFEVKVVRVDSVEKHPNADRLTIVRIGGYTCIANLKEDGTWRYNPGDLVVYVPADTVVPEATLKAIGFWDETKGKGILAGSKGDRVKPMKLRDVFSEGILIPVWIGPCEIEGTTPSYIVNMTPEGQTVWRNQIKVGDDVSDFFGLTKYEPPIPTSMSGEVYNAGGAGAVPVKYDIEAWEKYPNVFRDGEEVVVTEKLHGTFTGIACIPGFDHPEAFESIPDDGIRNVVIYSKGLGSDGLAFKDVEANANNLYVRSYRGMTPIQRINLAALAIKYDGIHLLGETFGQGVQDLHYGQKNPVFRIFNVYLGKFPMGRYANDDELDAIIEHIDSIRVPVLYRGPYTKAIVMGFRDGKDTISDSNVREGVVVCPLFERRDDMLGRVQLKFVSPAYKLRKGNVTENQ